MPSQKHAAILGATSALGIATARLLVDDGCELSLVARDQSKLEQVAADLSVRGATVHTIEADFDQVEEHDSLVQKIDFCDEVYFFYGTLPDQESCEQSWAATSSALHTNFISVASLLNRLANAFEQRAKGKLVIVSSVAGDRGRKSNYVYGSAKGALGIYCAGLRNRLTNSGVEVLTVKPGFIDTPMTAHLEKKPAALWVGPERVAKDIVKAAKANRNVIYTPWFWRVILLVIQHIPESIFKRLSL